jgi:hypothetical protein
MNAKDWFVNIFLDYLEEVSIITMGNASYLSTIMDKFLNTGPRKEDIKEWLRANCNEHDRT